MTTEQKREAIKTALVVVFGVLMLLSAFGPLAQYREWFLLAAGCVSIVAGAVFGVTLKSPADQLRDVRSSKIAAQRMTQFIDKGQG